MPLYEYTCGAGHTTEGIQGMGVESIPCPSCGLNAPRAGFNRVSVEVREGPEMARDSKGKYRVSDFKEASEELNYAVDQEEKKDGRKIKTPSLYKAGIREAKRRGARIRNA